MENCAIVTSTPPLTIRKVNSELDRLLEGIFAPSLEILCGNLSPVSLDSKKFSFFS